MKFKILIWIFVLIIGISGLVLTAGTNLVTQNVKQINIAWRTFQQDRSEKARLSSSLRTVIGYGGMIHHFKNYVLRQNNTQMDKAQEYLGAANNIINQFRTLGPREQEIIALDDIQRILNKYSKALLNTHQLIKEHKKPVEIDRLIKINDGYALRGLEILDKDQEIINRSYGAAKFHTKTKDLTTLKGIIGFGGMIHEYKNYILRQEAARKEGVLNKITEAYATIKRYKEHKISLAEVLALEDIESTLKHYEAALSNISEFIKNKTSAQEIDRNVKIDDSKAIRGFIVLEREIARKIEIDSKKLSQQLSFSEKLGEQVSWAIILLSIFTIIFSLWVLYSKLIKPLSELNHNMEQLASGNLSISIQGMDKNNEVGFMARNLLTFQENAKLKQKSDQALELSHEKLLNEIKEKAYIQEQLEQERLGLEEKVQQRTEALEFAKEEAILANETKTQFLSRMSHELRTPLNAILGFSEFLSTDTVEPLSEQQEDSVTEITDASKNLLSLIDEILELSNIELGMIDIELSHILLTPLIEDSINILKSKAQEKNINLSYNNIDEENIAITANSTKVSQIIQCLTDFALQKSADNSSVTLFLDNSDADYLKLNIGFPSCVLNELEQADLFEAFIHDSLPNSGQINLGMNMAIVKSLIELMQGHLGINSYPNVGSNFWVEFKKV